MMAEDKVDALPSLPVLPFSVTFDRTESLHAPGLPGSKNQNRDRQDYPKAQADSRPDQYTGCRGKVVVVGSPSGLRGASSA